MDNKVNDFDYSVVANIIKIMTDRGIKQSFMAISLDISEQQVSKILNGRIKLSLSMLAKIASFLEMREIDIITYPEVYVAQSEEKRNTKAILQVELDQDKKEKVLKLVFGERYAEMIIE